MADTQTYSLYVHAKTHSTHDLILNPEVFPHIKVNDYVQIYESPPLTQSHTHTHTHTHSQHKLTLRVSSLQAKGGRLEISILKSIAEAFNLVSYVKVYVQVVDATSARVDFVELAFRNKFVQRGDMTRYKKNMLGRTVHINQNIDLEGVNMLTQEISLQEQPLKCGIITENTNVVFRSRSARVFWLVQISSEMWEIDKNGDLYFEVFLKQFVEPIIDRWKVLGVTHSLSIIFFARTYYYNDESSDDGGSANKKSFGMMDDEEISTNASKCCVSVDKNISYQDFYKIVLDNCVYSDKTSFIRSMKEEFWEFPRILKWHVGNYKFRSHDFEQNNDKSPHETKSCIDSKGDSFYAIPSGASSGNVLEALNTTLNVLDKHFMDRDLERTGNSIVMISPGVGFFEVDPKLARITQQRMMDNGIGMDFISLSQPPLHIVPLFHLKPVEYLTGVTGSYEVPHWINLQFVNVDKSLMQKVSTGAPTVSSTTTSQSNLKISSRDDKVKLVNSTGMKAEAASKHKAPTYKISKNITADLENDLNTGSSVPLYTTDSFSFSPFPFGDVLQRHADALSNVTSELSSKFANESAKSTIDREDKDSNKMGFKSDSRIAIMLRLLSLPRALEKCLFSPDLKYATKTPSLSSFDDELASTDGGTGHSEHKSKGGRAHTLASLNEINVSPGSPSRGMQIRSRGLTANDIDLPQHILAATKDGFKDENLVLDTIIRDFEAMDMVSTVESSLSPPDDAHMKVDAHAANLDTLHRSSLDDVLCSNDANAHQATVWGQVTFEEKSVEVLESWRRSRLLLADDKIGDDSGKGDGKLQSTAIPAELKGISDKIPQNVIDNPECLLEFLASSQVNAIDPQSIRTLMKYYDKKVGMEACEVTVDKTSSSSKSSRVNAYLMNRMERGSFDDISFGAKSIAAPSYLQQQQQQRINNTSSTSTTNLSSSYTAGPLSTRRNSFSKATDRDDYEIGKEQQNEASLSILPDTLGGNGAKVMVRYPDGSGRTYRAYTPATTVSTDGPGGQKMKDVNSKTSLGIPRPDFSYFDNPPGKTAPVKSYNPSVLASPLITRASRGNRRQLGEVAHDMRAAEGGFIVKASKGIKDWIIPRPADKVKTADDISREKSLVPPPPSPQSLSLQATSSFSGNSRSTPIAIPIASNSVGNETRGSGSGNSMFSVTSSSSGEKHTDTERVFDGGIEGKPLAASLNDVDSVPLTTGHVRADSAIAVPSIAGSSPGRTMSSSLEVELLRDRRLSFQPSSTVSSSKPLFRKSGINPFRLEEGEMFLRMRTHNRRRWAHALPKIQQLDPTSKWNLNWKSLCQPAILPLTTDYLPSIDDVRTKYTVANYSLVLDYSVCPFTKPESLLAEMVNQRLAQEFQVIDSDQYNYHYYKKLVIGSAEKETPDQFFMILSMGHRIHFLYYIPSRGTVNVYRYMSRIGINDANSTHTHFYRIWSKQFRRFLVMRQKFHQFPEPEHAWNLTDEVLLGNQDILSENSRAKRIRFVLVPCNGVTSDVYQENFTKLINFLNKYCAEPMALKFLDEIRDSGGVKQTTKDLNVKFWLRRPGSGSSSSVYHDSPQWAYLRCEDSFSMRKAFHLEIYWIVCIASLMDDFVNMLFRRCGSWGLRLIQVPEFFCVANLQMHPFRGNPQIVVPKLSCVKYRSPYSLLGSNERESDTIKTEEKEVHSDILLRDYISPTQLIERLILQSPYRYNRDTEIEEANDWILDDKQRTDWEAMGLPEPQCHLKEKCPNIIIKQYQSGIGGSLVGGINIPFSSRSARAEQGNSDGDIVNTGTETVQQKSKITDKIKSFAAYASNSLHTASEKFGVSQTLGYSAGDDCTAHDYSAKLETQEKNKEFTLYKNKSEFESGSEDHSRGETPVEELSTSMDQSPTRTRSISKSLDHSISPAASTFLSESPCEISRTPPSNLKLSLQSQNPAVSHENNTKGVSNEKSNTNKSDNNTLYLSHGSGATLSMSPPLRPPHLLSQGGSTTNPVPTYKPRLRRHIHFDNQYMQLMGYAVVRVAAKGFVWLQSSTPRVSDVEKLGLDEKRNMSEKILEQFGEQCQSVRLCYEVLVGCIEEAIEVSDNRKEREKQTSISQERASRVDEGARKFVDSGDYVMVSQHDDDVQDVMPTE